VGDPSEAIRTTTGPVPQPEPESGFGIQPSERRYSIDRYPDYEFLEDGTPIMIRQPVRGKRMKLGPVEPLYSTSRQRYFALRLAKGRETKSESAIRAMIGDDSAYRDLFTIARFPQLRFDRDGRAFSLKRRGECAHSIDTDPYGFPRKTYILRALEGTRWKLLKITDATIRRMLAGKIGETAPIIPDHWKPLDGDFIDFALDPETYELYRIGRRVGTLLAPKLMRMGRSNRQYTISNAEGRIYQYSRRKILAIAGIDEDHPDFERALAAGSRVGD
jgi:hypothetical protein